MDEIVVRVMRAVACLPRLRILSLLVQAGELSPSELARRLHLSPHLVSSHLARLSSAGLIQRRHSGGRHYCKAESPYSEEAFSGKVTLWLRDVLSLPRRALAETPSSAVRRARDAEAKLHAVIFGAVTAFTNVRRLQILRRLAGGETVSVRALMGELRMSDAAVSRHMAKLIRRGYVSAARSGRSLGYRLAAQSKTPLHARLLAMVREEWGKRELRSSTTP